jgi:N-acetylglucosamine repressor
MLLLNNSGFDSLSGSEVKKYRLKKTVLNHLYSKGNLSTPELSKLTGMSSPTINSLLNELVQAGYVDEKGPGVSNGGRKPFTFGLAPDSILVIAIHIERFNSTIAVFNAHNQLVAETKTIKLDINADNLIDQLYVNTMSVINDNNIDFKKIAGIGVDMPGLVDAVNGINFTLANTKNRETARLLYQKFQIPVYLDNDARMQAYGEYMFGKAKGFKNAIIINVDYGIGLGMIFNGQLYGGHTGFAGEFGHIPIEDEGQLCHCGKRGCLETVASARTLVHAARIGIQEGKISQLTERFSENLNQLEALDIVNAAKSGDVFAISLLSKIGYQLGRGLAILIQLLNPEIIILGGSVAQGKQYFLVPIQQSLNRYCLEKICSNARLEISELTQNSGLFGSSAMVFEKLFNDLTY